MEFGWSKAALHRLLKRLLCHRPAFLQSNVGGQSHSKAHCRTSQLRFTLFQRLLEYRITFLMNCIYDLLILLAFFHVNIYVNNRLLYLLQFRVCILEIEKYFHFFFCSLESVGVIHLSQLWMWEVSGACAIQFGTRNCSLNWPKAFAMATNRLLCKLIYLLMLLIFMCTFDSLGYFATWNM